MPNLDAPDSGTLAGDFNREREANFAADILSDGRSILCKGADHGGGELCMEVIIRLQGDTTRMTEGPEQSDVPQAINNLRAGIGWGSTSASHGNRDTCAQAIAGSAS